MRLATAVKTQVLRIHTHFAVQPVERLEVNKCTDRCLRKTCGVIILEVILLIRDGGDNLKPRGTPYTLKFKPVSRVCE